MTDLPALIEHSTHYNDYWPPDFGWDVGGPLDPFAHPDVIVPFEFEGQKMYSTHRDAVGLWHVFFRLLVPSIKGGLNAAKTGSYNPDSKLPDGSRSFHTWGIAMDVNWDVNHMGQDIPDAHGYHAVPRHQATTIADLLGLEWGGNWGGGYHDDMHFESHLPPSVARQIQPIHWTHDSPFPFDGAQDVVGLYADPSPHSHGGADYRERLIVLHVQNRLRVLGDEKVDQDGVFSMATSLAVKRWQKQAGRKITGSIDHDDWHELFAPSPHAKTGGHE